MVAVWKCTRCGRSEAEAREKGCADGPCPMEPVTPRRRFPLLRTALVCAITVTALDGVQLALNRHHDERVAKAAYDYGKDVGENLGSCETMDVALRQPWAVAWAARLETVATAKVCAKYERDHAPGTVETIQMPKGFW